MRSPLIEYNKKLGSLGFSEMEWNEVFKQFLLVIHHAMDGVTYSKVAPVEIYNAQLKWIKAEEKVFVVSAIPALIIEYFGRKFYERLVSKVELNINAQKVYL